MYLVRNKHGREFVVSEETYIEHTTKLGKQWKIIETDYVDTKKIIKKEIKIPKETTQKLKQNGNTTIKDNNKATKQKRSGSKGTNVQRGGQS